MQGRYYPSLTCEGLLTVFTQVFFFPLCSKSLDILLCLVDGFTVYCSLLMLVMTCYLSLNQNAIERQREADNLLNEDLLHE